MTQHEAAGAIGQRNWWQRNWKWAVPVIGLSLLGLMAAAIFGLLSLVSGMMRSSEPYRHALAEARASAEVVAALGEPIEAGFMPSGNININNDAGEADLSIGVEGPDGEATVYVEATRKRKRWSYQTLVVALPDREIDLLANAASADGAEDGDDTDVRKSGAAKPLDTD
ncbi:cytochrome c oxidase assembly factor Coa1 family protein [Marilutibacter maris]|nr:cytochrome c oxidase assembly factor Coa1 family protein [Lysobacter maris]